MVSIKDLTPLLLGGAVIFVVARSGILKGFAGVGEGAAEAAEGLGGGIGAAGRGLGGGVGMAGQAAGLTIQDVLGISALLRPVGAVGTAATGEVGRWVEGRELEHEQEQEIDIAAHEQAKADLAKIQADMERKDAEEQAERNRLIEEEKTQYIKFVTEFPELIGAGFKYIPAGLSAAWRYSPTGLLQSYIMGQVSVEEEAAPQQSAPITIGGGGVALTTADTGGGYVAPTTADTGGGYVAPTTFTEILKQSQELGVRYEEAEAQMSFREEPEPEPEKKWYDPRTWW